MRKLFAIALALILALLMADFTAASPAGDTIGRDLEKQIVTAAVLHDGFPVIPEDAVLVQERPIAMCGENYGVYFQVHLTEEAVLYAYGLFELREDRDPILATPVFIVIQTEEDKRYFVSEPTGVTVYTQDAFREKYTAPCSLPGIVPGVQV